MAVNITPEKLLQDWEDALKALWYPNRPFPERYRTFLRGEFVRLSKPDCTTDRGRQS